MKMLLDMAERAWLPDPMIRVGIRRLNRMRLAQEYVHRPIPIPNENLSKRGAKSWDETT